MDVYNCMGAPEIKAQFSDAHLCTADQEVATMLRRFGTGLHSPPQAACCQALNNRAWGNRPAWHALLASMFQTLIPLDKACSHNESMAHTHTKVKQTHSDDQTNSMQLRALPAALGICCAHTSAHH